MNYKITGIYYTKPRLVHCQDGEVRPSREGVWIDIGGIASYNSVIPLKKVIDITYDEDSKYFSVYFDKGGMRVIPMLPDTEITYDLIDEKQSSKVK